MFHVALCAEVYVSVEPHECDDRMADQSDVPVYVCNDNEESMMRILQCCTSKTQLCIGWNSEWWYYKDPNKLNGTFQKYQEAGGTNLASVSVNITDYPIRYVCIVSASHGCEGGIGYIDIQGGIYNYIYKYDDLVASYDRIEPTFNYT